MDIINKFNKLQSSCSYYLLSMFLFYISAVSAYTSALKSSIMCQTEFQPKLLASRTISNVKTDEIFTNLLMQHGRKALIRNDETHSRSEELEYYGKVCGTPVKHCSEIFLGMTDDQENTNSILVVGKAGIGKSLFCQKVIRDWANNELFQEREVTEIPNLKFVYLLTFRQLNFFENKCVTLREILNCCSALDDKCNINDSTFEYIIEHPKQLMIILDGYDEYSQQDCIAENLEEDPNDARRKMPVAALCSKLMKGKILRGAIVMITSRPDESDKMGGIHFQRYVEIAGFSTEQVKEYIEKYFNNNENMKNAVLKHVMNNEDLVSFAHIPMLCYLLCFEMEYILTESENPDDLPASTTDIYTKVVDIFELKHCAESKYRQKEIPEQFKPPPVIRNTLEKLSELAAKLLLESKPTFDESEMKGEFELEEVNKLKGSGLLHCGQSFRTALITTTKHFSFTHLTVQEFLAARWFVKENRVPDPAKCSEMVFQFMAGVLSNEENEELMEKLIDLPFMPPHLRLRCLKEYRNKEFVKQFMRKNPQAFFQSHSVMVFECFSDVHCVEASFLLDIISELNKEEAGEAQHKYTDTFFTVKRLGLVGPHLTLSGIQRVCNSLKNEHCLVSLLRLVKINWSDEYVDFINRLLVRRLTTLILNDIKITDSGVARLCEALQDPSCKLTTLNLESSGVNDTGVASLGKALQHPSCKLTTLNLKDDEITDTGVASLCEALQHPSCKLTTLNLGSSGINDIGVASLGEALQHPSCKLTTLYLEGNDITDIGVASLCEALKHPNSKLTTLCISCRGISDTCVPSLCEALQHSSCKLTTLGLQHCRITGIGVASLCEALQHPSCKLTTLDLKGNDITDISAPSLCEALQHPSCKLTTLELPALVFGETFPILNANAQRYRPDLKVSYH